MLDDQDCALKAIRKKLPTLPRTDMGATGHNNMASMKKRGYYKDRKCAVNENPSVCIESAGSKTGDNRPLKNGSAVSNCSIVCW